MDDTSRALHAYRKMADEFGRLDVATDLQIKNAFISVDKGYRVRSPRSKEEAERMYKLSCAVLRIGDLRAAEFVTVPTLPDDLPEAFRRADVSLLSYNKGSGGCTVHLRKNDVELGAVSSSLSVQEVVDILNGN